MRRPTTADVLEAVRYVTGIDPLTRGRFPSIIRSRRLACHALREITESSYPEIGRALGYADHSTAVHQCRQPIDISDLACVLDRVAQAVEA